MKLGDFINKEILEKLSTKKESKSSTSLSIQNILRTHNLSYKKFKSEIRNLNVDLPSNIYSELPAALFNKITILLKESKKIIPLENHASIQEDNLYVADSEIKEIKRVFDINPFKALQLYKDSLARKKIKLKSNIITDKFEKLLNS